MKYHTVKIPENVTAKLDELLEIEKGDYTSRTDVIKQAVRLLYREKIVGEDRTGFA